MKYLLKLFLMIALPVATLAQQKPVYEQTRTDQVLSNRAMTAKQFQGVPRGTTPGFPSYVPDSVKNGALYFVTGVGLKVYDSASSTWLPAYADVTKAYVDAQDATKVPSTRQVNGKALSGDITLTKADVGLPNADNTSDANKPVSTLQQAAISGKLDKTGGTVTGDIQQTVMPVNANSLITMGYAQNLANNVAYKAPVVAASTANVNLLLPGSTLDGVTLTNPSRILLKNQTDATQNGIYVWSGAASALTRSSDANTGALIYNSTVLVGSGGAVNASTVYSNTNASQPTLGTDNITFIQTSGQGQYSNGTGIAMSGKTFSLDLTYTDNRYQAKGNYVGTFNGRFGTVAPATTDYPANYIYLNGWTSGAGTVAGTDNTQQALQKIDGNVANNTANFANYYPKSAFTSTNTANAPVIRDGNGDFTSRVGYFTNVTTSSQSTIGGVLYTGGGILPQANNTQTIGTSGSVYNAMYATTFIGALNGVASGNYKANDNVYLNNIYLPNTGALLGRNAANTAYLGIAYVDASNKIQIDNNAAGVVFGGTVSGTTGSFSSNLSVSALSTATSYKVADFLAPNMAASTAIGTGAYVLIGHDGNNYNSGAIQFHYEAAGSANNYLSIGVTGLAGILNVYGNAVVSAATLTAPQFIGALSGIASGNLTKTQGDSYYHPLENQRLSTTNNVSFASGAYSGNLTLNGLNFSAGSQGGYNFYNRDDNTKIGAIYANMGKVRIYASANYPGSGQDALTINQSTGLVEIPNSLSVGGSVTAPSHVKSSPTYADGLLTVTGADIARSTFTTPGQVAASYIPYTGATGNLNLGSYSISATAPTFSGLVNIIGSAAQLNIYDQTVGSNSFYHTFQSGVYKFGRQPSGGNIYTVNYSSGAVDFTAVVSSQGPFNPNISQTVLNGSSSGQAYCMMPFQGTSYKKVMVYFTTSPVYQGTSTYTFPTAFTKMPLITVYPGGVVSNVTTTSVSFSGTNNDGTGWLVLEGY